MNIKEKIAKKAAEKQRELKNKEVSKKKTKAKVKKETKKKEKPAPKVKEVIKPKKEVVTETKSDITGDLIKDAMKAKKLTQGKLAKLVGTTPYMIGQFQNGKQAPKKKFIPKLEEILEIKLSGEVADIKAAAGDTEDLEKEWEEKIIDKNPLLDKLGVEIIWTNKAKGEYFYNTLVKEPYKSSSIELRTLQNFNKKKRKNYKTWRELTEAEVPVSKQMIKDYGHYLHWGTLLAKQDLTNESDDFIWEWNANFRMLVIGIIKTEYDFDIEKFKVRWEEVRNRKDPKVIRRRNAFRKGQRRKEQENMAQCK